MAKAFPAAVESQILHPGDRFRLEQQRWHCTHSDVTAELARRWKFPDTLLVARLHLNLDWLQDKLLTVADLAPEVDSMVG